MEIFPTKKEVETSGDLVCKDLIGVYSHLDLLQLIGTFSPVAFN